VLCIVYLGLTILSFVANGCVILLAIWERCPELDSLTFVLVTSLSFNQLFISFFIYPCELTQNHHPIPVIILHSHQFSNLLKHLLLLKQRLLLKQLLLLRKLFF
jgi:hypothetical protein